MLNRFQKFIYYLSAESPILIVLGIMWFYKGSAGQEQKTISLIIPIVLLTISVIMVFSFIKLFNKTKSELSVIDITGKSFCSEDVWLVGYVITYLLPLISIEWKYMTLLFLAALLIILILVFTFSDHVTPHPILFCMGYHFYKLEVEGSAANYIVISKERIRNLDDFSKVSRMYDFLLIRQSGEY